LFLLAVVVLSHNVNCQLTTRLGMYAEVKHGLITREAE